MMPGGSALRGAESVTLGPDGYMYAGVRDGWIVRFDPNGDGEVEKVAHTGEIIDDCGTVQAEPHCGRPLGMVLDQFGNIFVADAYLGILAISSDGSNISSLVTQVEGQPLMFPNSIDLDPETGILYFTDSSLKFHRYQFINEVTEGGPGGRLVQYDIRTGEVRVLAHGIPFANGLCLSHDRTSVLFVSTARATVFRYWVKGPQAGLMQILCNNLPTIPDNIKRGAGNSYWVAGSSVCASPFCMMQYLAPYPFIRKMGFPILKAFHHLLTPHAILLQIEESGEVVRTLQDDTGLLRGVSEGYEINGKLFVCSFDDDLRVLQDF